MRSRRPLTVDCIVSAALAVLLLAALGSAHTGSEYYGKKWRAGERDQRFGFANAVPEGNFRDRVDNGAAKWNALAGNMHFYRGTASTTARSTARRCPVRRTRPPRSGAATTPTRPSTSTRSG